MKNQKEKHKNKHIIVKHFSLPCLIENKKSGLFLLIGENEKSQNIIIDEKSLYQNILITGNIGTGAQCILLLSNLFLIILKIQKQR